MFLFLTGVEQNFEIKLAAKLFVRESTDPSGGPVRESDESKLGFFRDARKRSAKPLSGFVANARIGWLSLSQTKRKQNAERNGDHEGCLVLRSSMLLTAIVW